ncbi:MAG: Ig-like domain-containing protein, partial [Armatimonadota bacterium]
PSGLDGSDTFRITVTAVNDPPVFTGLPDRSMNEDTTWDNAINLWSYASDETPDADLVFTITGNTSPNCGVSIDSNHYIDISPVANWNGYSDVTIRCTDTGGLWAEDTFRITVLTVNDPPTLAYLPDKLVAKNSSINNAIDLWIYAYDEETSDWNLVYTITGNTNPNCGVSIDAGDYVDINPVAGWTGYSDVTIRATDEGGLWAEDTFRIVCAEFFTTISQARAHADGTWVAVQDKVVTGLFPSYYYIEEPNRTSGIRVAATDVYGPGYAVTVAGTLGTSYAERQIVPYYREYTGEEVWVQPLGMTNQNLGGKSPDPYTRSVPEDSELSEEAQGLYNVGLLVRTTGQVIQHASSGRYYITDGSRTVDNATGVPSVLVNGVPSGYQPPVGSYVTITGISGASTLSGWPLRVLRPRSDSDIRIDKLNVAYIYYSNTADAQSFKDLLDAYNLPTDLIYIKRLEYVDWSKYHVVLIGQDTGSWTTPADVSAVLSANTPIVGIGTGGARFMDAVTSPDLYLGWLNSWVGSNETNAFVYGGSIYSYPYYLGVYPGQLLNLYASPGTGMVSLYDPTGATNRLLREDDDQNHFPVSSELGRFYQWGFYGAPDKMTDVGRKLFVNLVFSTVR